MPNKKQFLESEAFKQDRLLLTALLEDDKDYTKKDVERLIRSYKKKEVK